MTALTWPKVMLFGDSLTQRSFSEGNWGANITDKLQRKCDVLNRGFSGYNSRWCRLILPKILTKEVAEELVAFTILLGSNDANHAAANPHQHVPLNEYKENMNKMVEYAKSVGLASDQIILMSPPPVNEPGWATYCKENGKCATLDIETTGLYAQAAREVANAQGIGFVDLFLELKKEANWENLLCDGLHLSPAGGEAVANLLWPLIDKRVQHLPPQIFPSWDEVDSKHPENTFH